MAAYRGWNSPWPYWGNVNPLNHWDTNSPVSDSGHATSSGIVLTDSGKSWTPSQFIGAGYFLYNTNSGMAWAITANDATTITTESGYHDIAGGAGANSYFTSGDGYQIYQVNHILDQPGTGQGDLISGDTPLNSTTGTAVWPHSAADPVYIWGNTLDYQYPDSAYGPPVNGGAAQSYTVQSGRDWIDGTPKPGYIPLVYPHPLQAQEGGGSPTFTLTVINGTGSGTYTTNSVVSIVANSSYGQTFYVWTGSTGDVASVHLASTTVGLTGNDTVTATYTNNPGGGSTIPPAWLQYHP
jgi:hypothetical protein